ncbi:MAG TPA: efflux RND transporter periplasmic adaptor subunit [Gemmatimonadaceae bacterium]|nr:efflux RND transporter periplasmic adaptor subunit [Gemmatimonadaceae bacterium]
MMNAVPSLRARTAALLLPMLAAAACGKPAAEHQPTVPVRVAAVRAIAAPYTITANGVAEPLQTVSVEAQVGGILTAVTFNEGDDVKAGQVLFRIDPRPFEATLRQAQAALARDAAQAENAQRDAERYRALVAKDYVTKSQADQAEATATALSATLQADSAAVETARLNLAYSVIRAPIDGRTGSLLVRRGNLVKANAQPLVVINQIHPILVRFPVTQPDFLELERRARQGPVPVRVSTADSVPLAESGTLTFIDNAVDSLTGTVMAKARFENATRALWPGEFVRVTVQLGVQENALAVPTAAVVSGQNGNYVFVIDAGHSARVRPVVAGRAVGAFTVIDSGLVAGEQVVTDGQSRLVAGARVDARPADVGADSAAARGPGAGA